jgi:hypothetical protein
LTADTVPIADPEPDVAATDVPQTAPPAGNAVVDDGDEPTSRTKDSETTEEPESVDQEVDSDADDGAGGAA